ncbi:MAG: DUF1722 domain-containing protein [Candidatus Abyssobacteria bacterium SURF_17]|uniref:DUF1722 domain-containing protein n=1 Tax=Candidatus Abyssobacteria bacterium SURF_17 TaxID=2093361 RepID=A0A419EZ45_9BACT|nr:MAG: DUF1722 domain-containing protein [Candidatus Abyssubacteria bacterium SURF_17]
MQKSEEGYGSGKPRVGISTCLLGEPVRFDGGHKRDRYITDTLGKYFDWVPVCPEVECGLTVPRESMHLEGEVQAPRLITGQSRVDHTERMSSWAKKRLRDLENEDLCGFIFKSNSPSSGMERVRIYDAKGIPHKAGTGIFARAFMEHFPLLPVEEEGRLCDPHLRENFIERIFCLRRYRTFLTTDGTVRGLVNFHTDHKMLLLAHNPHLYREMGKLVAHAKEYKREELIKQYQELMLRTLKTKATVKKNANVLLHMMGFLKTHLTSDEKQEMLGIIENYKRELIPLIVPVTLMQHYVRKYGEPYLERQYYLNPHPIELQLRNHA